MKTATLRAGGMTNSAGIQKKDYLQSGKSLTILSTSDSAR